MLLEPLVVKILFQNCVTSPINVIIFSELIAPNERTTKRKKKMRCTKNEMEIIDLILVCSEQIFTGQKDSKADVQR